MGIISRMARQEACSMHSTDKKYVRISVEIPEIKKSLGRLKQS
jgi:hypothetical protein